MQLELGDLIIERIGNYDIEYLVTRVTKCFAFCHIGDKVIRFRREFNDHFRRLNTPNDLKFKYKYFLIKYYDVTEYNKSFKYGYKQS